MKGGAGEGSRLAAIDVMRGLVIALMSVDHASATFNAGRVFTDSAFMWTPGTRLDTAQFLTRWVTHLCAPTFVLLAGVALAMSTERRRARGEAEASITRHILARGALLVAFEVLWMSMAMVGPGNVLCQVLFAIGASLCCMAFLRRLSARALFAVGALLALGSELLLGLAAMAHVERTLPAAVLVAGGFFFGRRLIVAYPLLPWLSVMCLGWALGRQLLAWGEDAPRRAARLLSRLGAALLGAFIVVRGVDGYGNMRLYRDDGSIVQWLHVSKYPPSVTFLTLELGLASLVLAALFARGRAPGVVTGVLERYGKVSLFYYLLHIHLMEGAALALGVKERLGLGATWLGGLAVLVVLYPACGWYARYKAAHPRGVARFV